jgi:hypothetical protein
MENKCRNCKEMALPNRKYCQKHLDYINLKARERVGKCKQCTELVVEGKTRCAKHLEEGKIKSKERKEKLKEQNLCRDCGKPKNGKKNLCESCGNKSNERSKDKLAERQKGNLCTSCGFEKENKDKAYCYVCTEKDNLRLKERRIIRKENDLCTHCGNSKDSASLMCDECNLEYRSHSERLRKRRKKNGLCYHCGEEAIDNKSRCFNCNLNGSIRQSVKNALIKKNIPKSARTEELLGCSIDFFREHMKNLMADWMNEDNYGVHIPGEKRWQIGHRRPVASFDLVKVEEQKKCWHYTNLFPQEASENIMLGDLMVFEGKIIRGRHYLVVDID